MNLRLRRADVARARAEADERGVPYQHVIRDWVSTGAIDDEHDNEIWERAIARAHADDGTFAV